MAQKKTQKWSELKVGLMVIAAFLVLAFIVLKVGSTIPLFSKTMTITAYFPSANGVREGAEVWVDGILVGNVKSVTLNSTAEPKDRVAVKLEIDQKYKE